MKRICLALLLLALLLLSACGGAEYEASGSHDFLKAVDGNRPLSSIALPGTHDSGALYDHMLAKNTAKCQSLTVREQLYIGVKYFDIRLVRKEGVLSVYHGPVDQKLSFDEVLSECYAYLDAFPTEALILSVKEEGDMIGENQAFDEMVADKIAERADKWYLGGDIPTLDTVRGKIVLWSRFSTERALGFDATGFRDNSADFTIERGEYALRVEDYYDVSDADAKWEAIKTFLDVTKTPSDKTYYLTNTSGYRANFLGLPNIRKVSDPINERLLVYLTEHSGFCGIIATDHITKDIAEAIIALNLTSYGAIERDFMAEGWKLLEDKETTGEIKTDDGVITYSIHTFQPENDGGLLGSIGSSLKTAIVWEFSSEEDLAKAFENNDTLKGLITDPRNSEYVNGNCVLTTFSGDAKEIFNKSK